jgi:hypothetical protein
LPRKKPQSVQERRTPIWLFAELAQRFTRRGRFMLDAFAEPHNALCPRYLTKYDRGELAPWVRDTFWNPPFEMMEAVVKHALDEALRGRDNVGIGPAGGSQIWLHEYAIRGTIALPDVRINYDTIDGRPTGNDGETGADRDSTVMLFGRGWWNPRWKHGEFRVISLPLRHVAPRKSRMPSTSLG